MNWAAVKRHNARRSQRKAQRESNRVARERFVAEAGGPIKVGELRGATYRVEPPAPGRCHGRSVWTFRGRDWVLGYSDGDRWQSMNPFVSWQQDPDHRYGVPLTAGAAKWLASELARLFPE